MTTSTTFDPFAKLVSGKSDKSNIPKTAEELKEAVDKLPYDQNRIFRKVYKLIRTEMRSSSKDSKKDFTSFLKQMVTKLGSDAPTFNEDEARATKLIYERNMADGKISKALSLYPVVEKDIREDIKGLTALESSGITSGKVTWKGFVELFPYFLEANPTTMSRVQKIIGDPAHFTTLTPAQHDDLRTIGTAEPLYFLFSQKIGDTSRGCDKKGIGEQIRVIFPDLDYKIIDRLCNFANMYKNVEISS